MVNIMNWWTSSYSSGNGGECVEVASLKGAVAVRDTKQNGTGPCCGSLLKRGSASQTR